MHIFDVFKVMYVLLKLL